MAPALKQALSVSVCCVLCAVCCVLRAVCCVLCVGIAMFLMMLRVLLCSHQDAYEAYSCRGIGLK